MPASQEDTFNAVYIQISSRGHNSFHKHKMSITAKLKAQEHHALNIQDKAEFTRRPYKFYNTHRRH
jgi:hypothetical protein